MLRISNGERCMRLMEVLLRRATPVSLASIGLMLPAWRRNIFMIQDSRKFEDHMLMRTLASHAGDAAWKRTEGASCVCS